MEIIVLQHIEIEDPGYIKDLMILDDFNITTIELDKGEKIPNKLDKFDGMLCMVIQLPRSTSDCGMIKILVCNEMGRFSQQYLEEIK